MLRECAIYLYLYIAPCYWSSELESMTRCYPRVWHAHYW